MRIFAFHLLNDYSGSPKVLSQLLKGWTKSGLDVHMVTCSGREGFLSNIPGVSYHYYTYKFAQNPYIRLLNLTWSQKMLFWKMLFKVKKTDIIYINTVLPFGAAFLGKIKGCRVIYHVHETTVKPPILKKILFGIVKWAAKDVIYVSNYLAEQEPIPSAKTHILFNALEADFFKLAKQNRTPKTQLKNALLVCSLKDYKGVNEFVNLANSNASNNFRLIVNATKSEIESYFETIKTPENLEILPVQTNLPPHYQWADLILNLSRPDGWIETFGLTIIEGMAYGLPAIVPPVGGITELIKEGFNGYQIDSRNTIQLDAAFKNLVQEQSLYQAFHQHALETVERYREDIFISESIQILS
jgi:glycosyltransferase involved in cell wall biosynthesis